MKRNLTLLITLVLILCFTFTLSSCSRFARRADKSTNTNTDSSTDVSIDTNADTNTDTSVSTNTDTSTDTSTATSSDTSDDILLNLLLPVSGKISKDYSDTVPVYSETMHDYRTHSGVDIAASLGDEVLAVADGIIVNVWVDPFMGTCISIQHSGNAVSIYKNLDPNVKDGIIIGASVKRGDVIAAVGQSAMNEIAEVPHLHYELKVNDKHVDPKDYIEFSE